MNDWNEEMDGLIKQAATDGYSRSQIAAMLFEKFGVTKTRNAVIGRLGRLGFGDVVPVARRKSAAPKPHPKPSRIHDRLRDENGHFRPTPKAEPVVPISRGSAWLPIPESLSISIVELRSNTCRWPLWDGPAIGDYCGAECSLDQPYCTRHRLLAAGSGTPGERNAAKAVPAC